MHIKFVRSSVMEEIKLTTTSYPVDSTEPMEKIQSLWRQNYD